MFRPIYIPMRHGSSHHHRSTVIPIYVQGHGGGEYGGGGHGGDDGHDEYGYEKSYHKEGY